MSHTALLTPTAVCLLTALSPTPATHVSLLSPDPVVGMLLAISVQQGHAQGQVGTTRRHLQHGAGCRACCSQCDPSLSFPWVRNAPAMLSLLKLYMAREWELINCTSSGEALNCKRHPIFWKLNADNKKLRCSPKPSTCALAMCMFVLSLDDGRNSLPRTEIPRGRAEAGPGCSDVWQHDSGHRCCPCSQPTPTSRQCPGGPMQRWSSAEPQTIAQDEPIIPRAAQKLPATAFNNRHLFLLYGLTFLLTLQSIIQPLSPPRARHNHPGIRVSAEQPGPAIVRPRRGEEILRHQPMSPHGGDTKGRGAGHKAALQGREL